MSYTTPFIPAPLPTGPTIDASGTTQWQSTFLRHGSMEQPVGAWSSITPGASAQNTPRNTPPGTPRSYSGRRTSRSRDRRDASPRRSDESDQVNQGWGPRIILMEQKIADLQVQLNSRITATQSAIEGRLNSIDAVLPQRLADIEQRQMVSGTQQQD